MNSEVIAGISTPIGMGAISIIRLSGTDSLALASRFFASTHIDTTPTPNMLYLGTFRSDGFVEKCMMVYFRAPRSYTGEDVVEFQLHGGMVVTDLVLRTLIRGGARLAEAGEFTKRAYYHRKLTLSEAEGIMAVIHAESESALGAASSMMAGGLGQRIAPIMQGIENLILAWEASLDYPDEMQDEVLSTGAELDLIIRELTSLAATAERGKLVRYGISVAIVGTPNAGKSSLLNAILKEERAIVTPIAGTTRDTLCESVQVGGVRLNLLDTAGLRETDDPVESIGVARAHKAVREADAIIYVLDGNQLPDSRLLSSFEGKHVDIVRNKGDLIALQADYPIISAKTGEGVDELLTRIASIAQGTRAYGGMLTEIRHIQAVERALEHLRRAAVAYQTMPIECATMDVKSAYSALGEIDGLTASEQLIDGIFSRFCVGK